jgi:hypothetical protein
MIPWLVSTSLSFAGPPIRTDPVAGLTAPAVAHAVGKLQCGAPVSVSFEKELSPRRCSRMRSSRWRVV